MKTKAKLSDKIKVELTVADLCYAAHSVNEKSKSLFKENSKSTLAKKYRKTADKLLDLVAELE